MAVDVGPPGRNGVEDAAAIVGIEIDALGVRDAQRRGIERFLRERMPDAERIICATHALNARRWK